MKARKWVTTIIFIAYCVFIVWYTLLKRQPTGVHEAKLQLFWSYSDLIAGKPNAWNTVKQNLSNIVFFIPFGILFPWRKWRVLVISVAAFSVAIELSQYVLTLGLCEVDDVICNMVGAVIGFAVARLIDRKRVDGKT